MVSRTSSFSEESHLMDPVSRETSSLDTEIQSVARCRIGDAVKGLARSRIFRAVVCTGLTVGVLFALVSNPVGWMVTAAVVGGFAVGLLLGRPCKTKQKIEFEISALGRLGKTNYHEIFNQGEAKIFLGALPNRITKDGEHLVNEEGVGAVLSVNEPWERDACGLSWPLKQEDWRQLDVEFQGVDVKDHTLLDDDQLNQGADFIHGQIEAGKNVYVHCRAGKGRSAMMIAAYLIKYREYSVDEACELIKSQRDCSTIMKKTERLNEYATLFKKAL